MLFDVRISQVNESWSVSNSTASVKHNIFSRPLYPVRRWSEERGKWSNFFLSVKWWLRAGRPKFDSRQGHGYLILFTTALELTLWVLRTLSLRVKQPELESCNKSPSNGEIPWYWDIEASWHYLYVVQNNHHYFATQILLTLLTTSWFVFTS
jgi:hypothetical protein